MNQLDKIPTLDEFVEDFWKNHTITGELSDNGQFDDLPYYEYEKLYGKIE